MLNSELTNGKYWFRFQQCDPPMACLVFYVTLTIMPSNQTACQVPKHLERNNSYSKNVTSRAICSNKKGNYWIYCILFKLVIEIMIM